MGDRRSDGSLTEPARLPALEKALPLENFGTLARLKRCFQNYELELETDASNIGVGHSLSLSCARYSTLYTP